MTGAFLGVPSSGMLSLASAWLVVILGANPYLVQGRQAYRQLDYERAEAQLRLAQKVSGTGVQDAREVDDLLARTLVAQGRMEEAEDVYRALLARDAAAPEPADAAPKIQRLFLSAKRRVYPPHFVALTLKPSAPQTVGVGVVDPWNEVRSVECQGHALSMENGEARGVCADGSQVVALDGQRHPLAQVKLPGASVPATAPMAAASNSRTLEPARGEVSSSPALQVDRSVPPPVHAARGLFQRPGTYVALSAVLLGAAATGLAIAAHGDQSSLADPRSAASAQDTYHRVSTETVASWIVGGGAAAAAGTSIVLFSFGS